MAGQPMPMKGLLAELEQRKLKPVPVTADKPKPSAVKPPVVVVGVAQNSPATSPIVKPSTIAKPSAVSSAPKEATTNGAPNKWNPVKITSPVTPVKPQTSTSSVAMRSPGVAAVVSPLATPALLKAGLKPTTTSTTANESPARPQPAGRGAGRGHQVGLPPSATTKPTPGLKPGVAGKRLSSGEQLATSPEVKSSGSENGTQAPAWMELVKKRNAAKSNGEVVGNSNKENKIDRATPPVVKQFPLSKKSESDQNPSLETSESQQPTENEAVPPETGSNACSEVPCDAPEVKSDSGTAADQPTAVSPSPLRAVTQSKDRNDHTGDGDIIFTAGSKSYRRVVYPAASGAAPPRKPAKPPAIDLTVYHRQAGADIIIDDDDNDEELYDDALCDITRKDARPISTVSRISEYTEEEETGAARHWRQTKHDDVADEIYDDVGDGYQDGEIYQELD